MNERMRRLLIQSFTFLLLLLPCGRGYSTEEFASWLRVKYTPVSNHIESIPIRRIDKRWAKVLVLRMANQPPDVASAVRRNEQFGYQFEAEGDFNGDAKRDKAMVGVYENKNGEVGRFFLVLTEEKPGRWKPAFLYKIPGEPGFGILLYQRGRVSFATCMECDTVGDLLWVKGRYRIRWYSTP
jgi:hypothetical protein